jgi:dTDP-4-dehydrorhamnose reductase
MRILVTGATGFVGGNVARVFQVLGDQVLCAVRRRPPDGFGHPWRLTDLMDTSDVRRALEEHQAQAVVHLAIRNDLLDLYQDRRGAYADYVTTTRRIVDAANGAGAVVLYVSTDWVFDGTGHMVPEDEPVNPVNLYGLLKALSEQTVLDRARRGLVARIGGVQGTHLVRPGTPRQQDAGFGYLVLSIVDALSQGRSFDVWESDRINSVANPVLASDAGRFMRRALQVGADGVLHLVGDPPRTGASRLRGVRPGCGPAAVRAPAGRRGWPGPGSQGHQPGHGTHSRAAGCRATQPAGHAARAGHRAADRGRMDRRRHDCVASHSRGCHDELKQVLAEGAV